MNSPEPPTRRTQRSGAPRRKPMTRNNTHAHENQNACAGLAEPTGSAALPADVRRPKRPATGREGNRREAKSLPSRMRRMAAARLQRRRPTARRAEGDNRLHPRSQRKERNDNPDVGLAAERGALRIGAEGRESMKTKKAKRKSTTRADSQQQMVLTTDYENQNTWKNSRSL